MEISTFFTSLHVESNPQALGTIQEGIEVDDLDHWIFHLFDRDFITVCKINNGRPDEIYPYSLHMLLRHEITESVKKEDARRMSVWFHEVWDGNKDKHYF